MELNCIIEAIGGAVRFVFGISIVNSFDLL